MYKRRLAGPFVSILFDAVIIALAFVLAYWVRFDLLIGKMPGLIPSFSAYLRMTGFALILWLAVFKIIGIYDKKFSAVVDEGAMIIGSTVLAGAIFISLLYVYKEYDFSRQVLIYAVFFTALFMLVWRSLALLLERMMHRKGWGITRVLVIGKGEIAQLLISKINNDPGLGYRVIGVLGELGKTTVLNIPVLGRVADLLGILKKQKIDEVIIASPELSSHQVLDIITEAESYRVEFKLVPGLLEIMASRVDVADIAGVPLVAITEIQWQGARAFVKRSFDLVSSSVLLTLLSPLLLLVAVLIRFDSKGQVLFSQVRIGRDGKKFDVYKFRSMVKDAEKFLPKLEHLSETKGHIFKIKDDPRLTRVGKIIRRLSIDELPQLLNVVRGEMSLVGPRPPLPNEVIKYSSWQKKRLRIAPGITGLWQVSGRSELPFDDMVRLDIFYIENWSLWLDFKILIRTIPAVLFAKGAY